MSEDEDAARDAELTQALFRVPLAEFVAARRALVAELKGRGDKAGASRVAGLSKPSVPAWLANQLFHAHPDAWRAAFEAGDRARGAQQRGGLSASDMQATLLGQRRALERLVQLGEQLAGELGQSVNRGHLRTLEDTLAALVADPARAVHGQLTEALEAPSFDALDLAAVLQAQPPAAPKPPTAPGQVARGGSSGRAGAEARRRAEQRVQDARRRVDELRVLEKAARERLGVATEALGNTARQVSDAEQLLARARVAFDAARGAASAAEADAREQADALERALDEARRAERDLRAASGPSAD